MLALVSILGIPLQSLGQSGEQVAVLGIGSPNGDDQLALALTAAMKRAIEGDPNWRVAPVDVSLEQMLMMHDCGDASLPCMTRIATTLEVRRVMYGELRRHPEREAFSIVVSSYDAEENRIDRRITDEVPRSQLNAGMLDGLATRYFAHLNGTSRSGYLRLRIRLPDGAASEATASQGRVAVDGRVIEVGPGGVFETEVPSGRRVVVAEVPGYHPHREEIDVVAGNTVSLSPTLTHLDLPAPAVFEAERSGGTPDWLPWTLAGVSAASTVASFLLWLEIDSIGDTQWFFFIPIDAVDNDPRVDLYSSTPNANFPGVDFCEAAERERNLSTASPEQRDLAAHVDDECRRANTLQLLSTITVSVALVSAVAAIITFIDPFEDDGSGESLSLRPYFNVNQGTAVGFESAFSF